MDDRGKLRIGLIGAGTHGARYLRHTATDVPDMRPTVLCRRDEASARALADEIGCRWCADGFELIADAEVDAIVIVTPPSSHFEVAAAAIAAGKPVLLEKPMCGTLDEARRLAALVTKAPPHALMVAQSLRWNPVLRAVRDLWPRLGRVHLVRMAQRLAPTTLAWQSEPAESVGGSVLLTGVHLFDTVRFLTGREFVEVDSRQRRVLHASLEDNFLARARLDDGCWASLEVSKYTDSRACWLEAVGEQGQLLADYQFGGIRLMTGSKQESLDVDASTPTLPLLLRDWLECVRHGDTPPVTVADGLATLTVADACYRSDRRGEPVVIPAPGTPAD